MNFCSGFYFRVTVSINQYHVFQDYKIENWLMLDWKKSDQFGLLFTSPRVSNHEIWSTIDILLHFPTLKVGLTFARSCNCHPMKFRSPFSNPLFTTYSCFDPSVQSAISVNQPGYWRLRWPLITKCALQSTLYHTKHTRLYSFHRGYTLIIVVMHLSTWLYTYHRGYTLTTVVFNKIDNVLLFIFKKILLECFEFADIVRAQQNLKKFPAFLSGGRLRLAYLVEFVERKSSVAVEIIEQSKTRFDESCEDRFMSSQTRPVIQSQLCIKFIATLKL